MHNEWVWCTSCCTDTIQCCSPEGNPQNTAVTWTGFQITPGCQRCPFNFEVKSWLKAIVCFPVQWSSVLATLRLLLLLFNLFAQGILCKKTWKFAEAFSYSVLNFLLFCFQWAEEEIQYNSHPQIGDCEANWRGHYRQGKKTDQRERTILLPKLAWGCWYLSEFF